MAHIVDPRPQVEANLARLKAEHGPGIDEAERAVGAAADKPARVAAKQVLKARRQAYREACREAKAVLKGPMAW